MQLMHEMPFGAAKREDGGVAFRLWAPGAKSVQLLLQQGNAWQALESRRAADGWHALDVPGAGAGTRYRWRIDGRLDVPDPASRSNPEGPHGPSEVVDPRAFAWDAGWRGRPWHETVVYELHVGCFTPEGTYAAAESRLAALAELGVTALELMPLAEFPGRYGWGYDGVLPYAPHARYGTPAELKHFVQAAHRQGLMVFVDVVYNHFGPDGNYLGAYAPQFDSARHRTPWGAALNFDGEQSKWVREFMIHNALFWIGEYGFDGLRIDAVHAMVDDGRPHIIEELSQRVRAAFPGRHVHLTLENDENDAVRLGPPGAAGLCEGNWNGDFHHCLHVLTSGERQTYYRPYGEGTVEQLARVLTRGFVFEGPAAAESNLPRRRAAGTIGLMNSINFLQCHDQVGNRAHGERLSALVEPPALRLVTALMLLAPGVPMLFMGEESLSHAPFLYFSDPDRELHASIREGRQREFSHAGGEEEQLPDPCSPETFERCKLELPEALDPGQREWKREMAAWLRLRRDELTPFLPRLRDGAHAAECLGARGLRVRWRFEGGLALELLANLGPAPLPLPAASSLPPLSEARELLRLGDVDTQRLGAWAGLWRWGRDDG